jgi:hypothetical protein
MRLISKPARFVGSDRKFREVPLTKSKTFVAKLRPLVVIGLTAVCGIPLQAQSGRYKFTTIATLGTPAPKGGNHINDYEPGKLNNLRDMIYGTDLGHSADRATFFGEGVFLRQAGQNAESELARSTGAAPGGGKFDTLLLGGTSLNDLGNGAFAFTLSPTGSPTGVNAGVYRYTQGNRTVTPVVVSDKTSAPGGGKFKGIGFNTSLNIHGELVFTGIFATDKGVHVAGEAYIGLGAGVFKADAHDQITSIVSPGDAAPGGGFFDYAGTSGAGGAWINQAGDIAFIAHVAGEESKTEGFPPQADLISALGSLYLKDARSGRITSIAHAGEHAPQGGGGGLFRAIISPVLNDSGDIAFVGDISPAPHVNQFLAVYLHSGNTTLAVARPDDPMPGGGKFACSGFGTYVNNAGEVVFNARLNTDVNGDGLPDSGLYVWSRGSVRLVARTGTKIPGLGTVSQLTTGVNIIPPPPPTSYFPNSGTVSNDLGQILFGATLSDGRGVLLLATPRDDDDQGQNQQ